MKDPMTVQQVAKAWSCSPEHVLNMIKRGQLPATRLGRLVRIERDDVEMLEQKGRQPRTARKAA